MIELTLLTIVLIIVVIVIKPGRTPPLENPLVIERIGQFRATFAPKLNLAQPLLEKISRNLPEQVRTHGDSDTLYFSIEDEDVRAHGTDHYLLAVTLHERLLHFVACTPRKLIFDYNTIHSASETVLSELKLDPEMMSAHTNRVLEETLNTSAAQLGVKIMRLTQPE